MGTPTYGLIITALLYLKLMWQHLYLEAADREICRQVEKHLAWTALPGARFVPRGLQRGIHRLLGGRLLPTAKALEGGCGPGRLTTQLDTIPGLTLRALDHDQSYVDHAREWLMRRGSTTKVFCADVCTHVEPDDSLDIFVTMGMDHHLGEEGKWGYVRRVFKWLKPGGILILGDEFLAPYEDEPGRIFMSVLWHEHIIDAALDAGYSLLAIEEAKTLLDDITSMIGGIKQPGQIEAVRTAAPAINAAIMRADLDTAIQLARQLLAKLRALNSDEPTGDPVYDLSRGDDKESVELVQQRVINAGFVLLDSTFYGPIHLCGAVGVLVFQKPL